MKSGHILCVITVTSLLMGSHFICVCVAGDTITVNDSLTDGETLVSAGRKFELGFFNRSIDGGRYVGIWYYSKVSLPRTVVWIANRDNPIPRSVDRAVLAMVDGNLKVLDGQGADTIYFSTGLASSSSVNRTVILMDSGNLALIDGQSGAYLWQSFENPTDTFLPGMRMDDKLKLTSWISYDDPGTGNYTFQQDQKNTAEYLIVKRTDVQWKGDLQSGRFVRPIEVLYFVSSLLSNFSRSPDLHQDKIDGNPRYGKYLPFRNFSAPVNYSQALSSFSSTRLFMNSSGQIQFYVWKGSVWYLFWSKSYDPCSVYNPCGNFGICSNEMGRQTCHCLPGFKPVSLDNWKSDDFSSGCERKTPCIKNTTDTFLKLKSTKVGSNYNVTAQNETVCREEICLSSCGCQAYSYSGLDGKRSRNINGSKCFIWTTNLDNIQMDDHSTDSISIRVAVSDIVSTRRDCESCGRYIVPYPLSNGSNCGDPLYSGFSCDKYRSQLQFLISNAQYDVVNIDEDRNRFVIQASVENADSHCGARNSVALLLNMSSPFQATNCNDSSDGEYYSIEISWKPPPEPLCNSALDCLDWPNSMCNASEKGLSRCLCFPNYQWDGVALKCTQVQSVPSSKQKSKLIVSITVIAAFLLVGSFTYIFFRRRIFVNRQGSRENILGNPMRYLDLDNSEMRTQDLVVEENKVIDVPFFSFESILTATDNFSDANKLGQGGFGPVYKGVFPGGKEIAVKRLSSHSGQGLVEFQNEVRLIAKLQHRNLVRLLGYCIRGNEKLLLYEYMINKSLDTFIFDKRRCVLLDWEKRFEIMLGITRGLLYLHQDSRLRIIHRDLKTSNILLDEDLNPKISDFGLARIVGGKATEANTERVVGTYGYMSPEYALEGSFSIKSDVFSFGVILLEVISGKRNIGFYEEVLSLLGYAWKLWQERNPMEFIDKNLLESCKRSASEVLKCINIGLLCVQEDPIDRPTMTNVLMMLGSETATLPSPNQPAFISRKRTDSSISGSSSSKLDSNSINKMTFSAFEGR